MCPLNHSEEPKSAIPRGSRYKNMSAIAPRMKILTRKRNVFELGLCAGMVAQLYPEVVASDMMGESIEIGER